MKLPNITSVKFLFGSIYALAVVVSFALIALILPAQVKSNLDYFFNDTLVPSIRQDGEALSEKTERLLTNKKAESLRLSEAAFDREKQAIIKGYANLIMPIVESLDTELLDVTTSDMLVEVAALKGIELKTEKDGSVSTYGVVSKNNKLIKQYTKILESDFSYVELTLYFGIDTLLQQIENEDFSFKQSLQNIDESITSIVSNMERETAIAQQEIISDVTKIIVLMAVTAAITFTLMSVYLLYATVVKRLVSADTILHDIAEGDLTKDIVQGRNDEIGSLFMSIRKMQEKLSHNIRLTHDNGNQLFESSEQLLSMSDESSKGIHSQDAQIEKSVSLIQRMELAVSGVTDKTDSAFQAAEESLKKSTLGKESVQTVVLAINDLSDNIKESEKMIHALDEESKAISSILDVITGISEQTNLLALNAAIEAARAGETGRGFAVVADEVRTLASRTQSSANDIRQMVERLSLRSNDAVKGMGKSRSNADNAVEKIQLTGEAIHSLSSSLGLMSDINMEIKSAADEQSIVSKEIHQNVLDISEIGQKNSVISSNISSQAQGLSEIAKVLKSLVSYFTLDERDKAE